MTAGERRAARKAARAAGRPLNGELETKGDRGTSAVEFSESPRGRQALDRWARHYDSINGAPDSPEDY